MSKPLWDEWWKHYHDEAKERSPSFEDDQYYIGGRASKQWPNKEDPRWWAEHGPKFIERWTQWREDSGLRFAEIIDFDTGVVEPAIEIEAWAWKLVGENGDRIQVKSVTDRVLTDGKELYIVDLKTGAMTPPWPLQLILNRLCLDQQFQMRPRWGGFWSARKGAVVGGPHDGWFDLSIYSDEWAWDLVRKAYEIRDRQLFLPNPNNLCKSACGVRQFCPAMQGSFLFERGATIDLATPTPPPTKGESHGDE